MVKADFVRSSKGHNLPGKIDIWLKVIFFDPQTMEHERTEKKREKERLSSNNILLESTQELMLLLLGLVLTVTEFG